MKKQFNIRLEESSHIALQEISDKQGRSMTEQIEYLIKKEIDTMIIEKLVGLKCGKDSTFFEVLQVTPTTITTYPSIKDGKILTWLEVGTDELIKNKKKITIPGYFATVTGNAVMAEDIIDKALNDEYSAIAIGPNTVQIYKKSDFENAIK